MSVQRLLLLVAHALPRLRHPSQISSRLLVVGSTASFSHALTDVVNIHGKRKSRKHHKPTLHASHPSSHPKSFYHDEHVLSAIQSDYADLQVPQEDSVPPVMVVDTKENPVDLLKRDLSNGTLDKLTAEEYLHMFYFRTQVLEARQAKRWITKAGVGKAVLTWLWDDYANVKHPKDRRLILNMVDFLIQEGHEEMAWKWFDIDKADRLEGVHHRVGSHWKTSILKALVQAKAKDVRGSLDEAIAAFFRANSEQYRHSEIPTLPTFLFLLKHLTSPFTYDKTKRFPNRYPLTSPESWMEFYDILPQFSEPERLAGNQAWMWLYHPRNPTPLPSLALLLKMDFDTIHATEDPGDVKAPPLLRYRLERMIELLHRQGYGEQAVASRNAMNRLFPNWNKNPINGLEIVFPDSRRVRHSSTLRKKKKKKKKDTWNLHLPVSLPYGSQASQIDQVRAVFDKTFPKRRS